MREIKFRGKKIDGDWYYGDLITETREFNRTCDKAYILPYWETLNGPIFVDKESVGQYTGLKDKNGREIYEGDITIDGYGTVTVIENDGFQWLERIVRLRDRHISKEILIMTKANAFRCEVIGNIYENLELLEGE